MESQHKKLKLGNYIPSHKTKISWKITTLNSTHGLKSSPSTIIVAFGSIPSTNIEIKVSNFTSLEGYYSYTAYRGDTILHGGKYKYIQHKKINVKELDVAMSAAENIFKDYLNNEIIRHKQIIDNL